MSCKTLLQYQRRARSEDNLPEGGTGMKEGVKVLRGTDIFISTWNLHRSPELWENPEKFDPTRWERPFKNPGVEGWNGYDPSKIAGLYPNEQSSDFAFLPFGGGQRKCVGDQFAMMEAAVTMVRNQLSSPCWLPLDASAKFSFFLLKKVNDFE